jgi:hypothetical protein
MKIFQNLFSTSRSQSGDAPTQDRTSSRGPETAPVKMNLDERMAFRRELLFETVRSTLGNRRIVPSSYRFKIMRTDRRGHCYAIMMDMSPSFMDSEHGQHKQLAETAALLTKNAQVRYGLIVAGVYWRVDETLDAAVAAWARPPEAAAPASERADPAANNIEKYERATADELAAFEAAWQKSSDIQIGDRTYSSDLAPLGEDPPLK